jgi:subtilisin family serine protease
MARLDPRLRYVQQRGKEAFSSERLSEKLGVLPEFLGADDPPLRVLVQFEGDLSSAKLAGLRVTAEAGDVAAGFVRASALEELAKLNELTVVESSRPLGHELDVSRLEIGADLIHALTTPAAHGAGVVIGLIDSGIDFTHPAFWSVAADGVTKQTRILTIWDQHLTPIAGESAPLPYGYGVEYTKQQINDALNAVTPIRHADGAPDGHGTHVACIAAGSPSAATGALAAGHFTGIAPGADIAVVANLAGDNIGTSANTLDAVSYLLAFAKRLECPIVINQSQGDNLGPHDGTSLLERGIDNLLGPPGLVMVKSAGNSGNTDSHAHGVVSPKTSVGVPFRVPPNDVTDDSFDLWYSAGDSFTVSVKTPGGHRSTPVAPNAPATNVSLANNNDVFIVSTTGDPFNGDNRIFIQLQRGSAPEIERGTWEIILQAGGLHSTGEFDIWIGRDRTMPAFLSPHVSADRTITTPGTAKKVITAGAYVTMPPGGGAGRLARFSSRGPSRDGRPLPTLCAPGEIVTSAAATGLPISPYHGLSGTSMAAPHVTGTAALLLAKCQSLTCDDVRTELQKFARCDAHTGVPAAAEWGAGKVDAHATFTGLTCP